MVPPIEVNQRDSARVENRGPSTTTIVPPSTGLSSAPARRTASRPSGQYGSANETCTAPES
nr:hypothetical protein GCM10020092_096490 [Actinoplanes digitatis]